MCRILQSRSRSQSIPNNGFMSSRSVISIDKFFLIPLLLASTVVFPVNLTSFLVASCYFRVTGNIFLSLFFSLFGFIILTGDPVSTNNSFSEPSFFYCHGNMVSLVG